MRASAIRDLVIGAMMAGSAHATERLLVLDRWEVTPAPYSIAKLDPWNPMAPGGTIEFENISELWSQSSLILSVHPLAVHPENGALFTVVRFQTVVGTINAMMQIDRETGNLTYIGGPSDHTAKCRFDPVTLEFHFVAGASSRVYAAPGGAGTLLPDLAYAAGDANAGTVPSSAGFAYAPPSPGADAATCYLIDASADSLTAVDFATGGLTTIGALGLDVTTTLAGPCVELDGSILFVADLGAGPRRFLVDPATGAATDAGEFPALHGITDLVLDPDLSGSNDADGDGYLDCIELAAGSNPGNTADVPFVDFPVAPPPVVDPLLAKSLAVKLDFATDGEDSIVLKGTLPTAEGFPAKGQTLVVEVGGYAQAFTIGNQWKAVAADGALLDLNKKSKKVKNGSVPFKLKLKHAALQAWFEDEGLVDGDVAAAPVSIHVSLWRAGATLETTVDLSYDATAGDSGVASDTD